MFAYENSLRIFQKIKIEIIHESLMMLRTQSCIPLTVTGDEFNSTALYQDYLPGETGEGLREYEKLIKIIML